MDESNFDQKNTHEEKNYKHVACIAMGKQIKDVSNPCKSHLSNAFYSFAKHKF
jgi:hypothetical protein